MENISHSCLAPVAHACGVTTERHPTYIQLLFVFLYIFHEVLFMMRTVKQVAVSKTLRKCSGCHQHCNEVQPNTISNICSCEYLLSSVAWWRAMKSSTILRNRSTFAVWPMKLLPLHLNETIGVARFQFVRCLEKQPPPSLSISVLSISRFSALVAHFHSGKSELIPTSSRSQVAILSIHCFSRVITTERCAWLDVIS